MRFKNVVLISINFILHMRYEVSTLAHIHYKVLCT
jgi:hypothetical protein